MAIGAKIPAISAQTSNNHPVCASVTAPWIASRTVLTRIETGFTSTKPCSHTGKVLGSTNTLLTNVNGTINIVLTMISDFSDWRIKASIIQIQDKQKEKINSSVTAITTPVIPPSGLKPRANPSTSIIVAAMV